MPIFCVSTTSDHYLAGTDAAGIASGVRVPVALISRAGKRPRTPRCPHGRDGRRPARSARDCGPGAEDDPGGDDRQASGRDRFCPDCRSLAPGGAWRTRPRGTRAGGCRGDGSGVADDSPMLPQGCNHIVRKVEVSTDFSVVQPVIDHGGQRRARHRAERRKHAKGVFHPERRRPVV